MSTRAKFVLVIAGYAAAAALASIALAIRLATTQGADAQAMSGMYAFGDLSLFVAVFFVIALLPTGAALFFLRSYRPLWVALSIAAVAVAATGLSAAALYSAAHNADASPGVVSWGGVAPLRMLAAPLFALALALFAVLAPDRRPRIGLLAAAFCEATVTAYAALAWFGAFTSR